MGQDTAISWANDTFNPWWGCWKISPECVNCYADTTASEVRDACERHHVSFHFKQWAGELAPGLTTLDGYREVGRKIHLPVLDGAQHIGFPR